MARYLGGQNKVVAYHESGTYGSQWVGSVFWIGQVLENAIDDSEGKIESRHIGVADRSFNSIDQGPRDVTGTFTYRMQDARFPFWAIGSVYDVSGTTNSVHTATEQNTEVLQSAFTSGILNPPISFSLEDSKSVPGGKNFIRTIRGCVPNAVTMNFSNGEKVTIDAEYVGQTSYFSSGTAGSVAESSVDPYLYSDVQVTVAGSILQTVKEGSFEVNNNVEPPHYLNGSRDISVPFYGARAYTVNLTMDLDSNEADMLYNTFFKNNTGFNMVLDMNRDVTATGSQHTKFIMSGCKVMTMENPSTAEGATESTVEIRPQHVNGQSWDRTFKYNPW